MKNILLLSILLFTLKLNAQNKEWINLTNSDLISDILDDGNILWVATNGGLVKFNKTTEKFIYYTKASANLPDNHLKSLIFDSQKKLWITTRFSGIGKFENDSCITLNTNNSDLPSNIWCLCSTTDSSGNLFFGSFRYFTKYNNNNWEIFPTGSILSAFIGIFDIKFDRNNTGWIGASWGLGQFKNNTLIEKFENFDKQIFSLDVDSNNNLWIGTDGYGLFKFDGTNFIKFDTTNSNISGNIIFDMKFDSQENLWLTTEKGLSKFDGKNWVIFNYKNSSLPEDDIILSIEIDKNDIKWIGTRLNGLYKFDNTNWKNFNLSNSIISNYISTIAIDNKQNVWLGSYEGLYIYDRNNWKKFDKLVTDNKNVLLDEINKLNFDSNGNLWVGFYSAKKWLMKYDGTNWYNFDTTNSPFSYGRVNCITFDTDKNIWIGTYKGLLKYDGTNWVTYDINNSPLTSNDVFTIKFDSKGNLWIGLADVEPANYIGGLMKFDGTNWTKFDVFNSTIPRYTVGNIEIDNEDNIWLACWQAGGISDGYGLTKFDGNNFYTYNVNNSPLSGNLISDITLDNQGNLWLCTQGCIDCSYKGGLTKYDRHNNWQTYNQTNSGIALDRDDSIVKIDSMGNKWIGHHSSGLSIFREGGIIYTGIKETNSNQIPQKFQLFQNYPNPFNPTTTIKYSISAVAGGDENFRLVQLKVYDILGKEVAVLVNKRQLPGNYQLKFNADKLSSGIYFYQLKQGKNIETKKMVLLR